MLKKLRFNLEWRAPNAAHFHHVVAAAAVVEITLRVTAIGISGIEPTIDHRRRRTLGIVPITASRRVTGNKQLTALAVGDLNAVLVQDARRISGNDTAARCGPDVLGRI